MSTFVRKVPRRVLSERRKVTKKRVETLRDCKVPAPNQHQALNSTESTEPLVT